MFVEERSMTHPLPSSRVHIRKNFNIPHIYLMGLVSVYIQPSEHKIVHLQVNKTKSCKETYKCYESSISHTRYIDIFQTCFKTVSINMLQWFYCHKHTVNALILVGYQILWFSWRVLSTNSSTHKIAIFCINYEGKYNGHNF